MGKLSAVQIRNLKEAGRYSDGDGLILQLYGPGRGSWMLRVQSNGRRHDIGLGSLSELGLAEAREKARELRKEAKSGVNLTIERKKEREAVPTFKAAAELVHEEHKAGWKNGKHQQQWINTLETYAFPKIGRMLVSDIEGPAIRDVLAPIAVGHTVEIAARHYADIPALRPLHEQTVADALEAAITGPRILPPPDEELLRSVLASSVPEDVGISSALLDGEQDVWLASCGNFYSSPFASVGTPCPTPFWGCLDCRNAVITARKLPAILAFLSFVDDQRAGLGATEWTAKFGHARNRIVQQILPAFTEDVVARARAQVAAYSPAVYLPPEARA